MDLTGKEKSGYSRRPCMPLGCVRVPQASQAPAVLNNESKYSSSNSFFGLNSGEAA